MKVLQVITRGDLGGAQTVMRTLVLGLRERGHVVEVMCGEAGPTSDALVASGVVVHIVPELRHGLPRPGDLRALARLRAHIRAFEPHVVHCHSSKAGVIGRLAARLEHVPSAYTAHGWPFQTGAPFVQRAASYLGEAVGSRTGSVVMCVSEAEAQLARSSRVAPKSRVVVIRNGIEDRPHRRDVGRVPVIVMVARFAAPKRQDVLVRALAELRDLEWECRFVGSGATEAGCRSLVRSLGLDDRIRFDGEHVDAADVLEQATVAVLLSDYEGQPISIIEAMRSGVPVLASDLPGTRELLSGGSGMLVANRPDEAASALRVLLVDQTVRDNLASEARSRFEARHRAEQMVERVEDTYRQIIRG